MPLCVGEYGGLKGAFTLQGEASMRVKHIRSYSVAELQELVKKKEGAWELVPAWLDANDLRPLLRDYQNPADLKKVKVTPVVPPGVFAEGQGTSCVLLCVSLADVFLADPREFVRAIKECSMRPIPWQGEGVA